MSTRIWRWFLGRISPSHTAFQRAQDLYDRYVRQIGLQNLGPTPAQSAAARSEPSLDEAERLYEKALELCRQQDNRFNVAAVHFQLGLLERLRGRFDRAIPRFHEALEGYEALVNASPNAPANIVPCHYCLGQALLEQGQAEDARRHLEIARDYDRLDGDPARAEAAEELLKRC